MTDILMRFCWTTKSQWTFQSRAISIITIVKMRRATTEKELNDLWQSRVKYDAFNLKLAGKEWPEIVETLGNCYNSALNRLTKSKSEEYFRH